MTSGIEVFDVVAHVFAFFIEIGLAARVLFQGSPSPLGFFFPQLKSTRERSHERVNPISPVLGTHSSENET